MVQICSNHTSYPVVPNGTGIFAYIYHKISAKCVAKDFIHVASLLFSFFVSLFFSKKSRTFSTIAVSRPGPGTCGHSFKKKGSYKKWSFKKVCYTYWIKAPYKKVGL